MHCSGDLEQDPAAAMGIIRFWQASIESRLCGKLLSDHQAKICRLNAADSCIILPNERLMPGGLA
jgi:hypothetical protein